MCGQGHTESFLMLSTEHKRLNALFAAQQCYLNTEETLQTLGLTINLRTETPKLVGWLKSFMDPYFRDGDSSEELVSFDLDFNYSDEIVLHAAWMIETHGVTMKVDRSSSSTLDVLILDETTYLMFEPIDGVVFLVDRAKDRIQVAYGSRTRWPGRQLCSVVLEIMTRYLEGLGYCNYHAGAYATERGVVIVCGKGGSGKTTLLSAMVKAGARLIANERCFIKADETGIYAAGFPSEIFVGMGSTRQFPDLLRFARNPTTLLGPQRRYRPKVVADYEPKDYGKLGDKFGMQPREFCAALKGPPPVVGGKVVGIVNPAINYKIDVSVLEPMDEAEQFKLMKKNTLSLGRDKHFQYWLDLGFTYAQPGAEALSKIPGLIMHYRTKDAKFRGMEAPVDKVFDALEAQRKE